MTDPKTFFKKEEGEALDFYEWQYYIKNSEDPFILSSLQDAFNDLKFCAHLSDKEQTFFEAYTEVLKDYNYT